MSNAVTEEIQYIIDEIEKYRLENDKPKDEKVRPLHQEEIDRLPKIPEHWAWMLSNDISTFITNGVHSPTSEKDELGIDKRMVRITDIDDSGFADFTNLPYCKRFVKGDYDKTLKKDDIYISFTGNVLGKRYLVKEDNEDVVYAHYFVRWQPIVVDPGYIYYVLLSYHFENFMDAYQLGSTQPNLKVTDLKRVPLPIAPLNEQKKISKILSDLDRQIELNRQTNQTLEHIAQAIFKSWFVDFEPTRAKIAAKQIGRARQDGERSAALREALFSEGRWPETIAGAIAEGDPERAAMAAISGKSLDELDQLSPEQQEQLLTTAALFPDALVDSELGEIPEGWDISQLGEIIEFNPKRTLKKGELAPYLDMKNVPTKGHLAEDVYLREMASGTKFINGDTLLARITPCLENGKTAYVDFLDEGQVAWGSTEYIVMRPKNDRPISLGYLIARLDSFRAKAIQTMTGTSGRQRANAKALSEQAWINYPLELLNVFDRIACGYLAKAKENGDENRTLSELRDVLLPKLLSGELAIEST